MTPSKRTPAGGGRHGGCNIRHDLHRPHVINERLVVDVAEGSTACFRR